MTEDELKVIEARAGQASPTPWRSMGTGIICAPDTRQEAYVLQIDKNGWPEPLDADFIAAARSDVPALISEVRRPALLVLCVLGIVPFAIWLDRREPEVGKRCETEGARTCETRSAFVLKCRRWEDLGGLAWDFEKNCHPGTCSEGRCVPR